VTFFLDRTHQGKLMVQFLRELGMCIEVHKDHFGQEEDDDIWIPICAQRGWTIVSGDQGLEKVALNVKAVTESGAKVFILTDSNSPGLVWAASIITGRHKMQRLVNDNEGPFFVTVGHGHDLHIGHPRFIGDGKPKERAAVSMETIAVPDETPKTVPDSEELKPMAALFD
jgi:hypothetical protein